MAREHAGTETRTVNRRTEWHVDKLSEPLTRLQPLTETHNYD